MLSIHYVSVMMCIFDIDWQHYWKCDWILNIGANAHGKRTVSTKQPQHKWQTWQSGFQWHRRDLYRASLVTRLIHSATVPMHLLFGDVYWSLGRREYFGVSNVALVEFNVSDSKAAITPFIYTFDYLELLVSFQCLNVRVNGMVTRRVSVRHKKYQMPRIRQGVFRHWFMLGIIFKF